MKARIKILFLVITAISLGITLILSESLQGKEEVYEINPEYTLPQYRTDAARAIDAYQYTMDRYMNITEEKFAVVNYNIQDILIKLEKIDGKLNTISERMANIEKKLGIKPAKKKNTNTSNKPAKTNKDEKQ